MGIRYSFFRIWYAVQRKSGLLKRQFPTDTKGQSWISKEEWLSLDIPFFFQRKDDLNWETKPDDKLEERVQGIFQGDIPFFNAKNFSLGTKYDWITNPDSGFTYDINKHWTEIESLGDDGDIKFVWEKSRFSYFYSIIRYDQHYQKDSSQFIIDEILSWIEANPENKGPNYVCSQEISIRLLNWTFALMYYRDSAAITDKAFSSIVQSIYVQAKHVYANINFSRIAVRNNHAITECFLLYFVGVMFPFFSEASKYKSVGNKYLIQELEFQFFDDGGYIQYAHNYHRVAIQVLTWALHITKLNGDILSDKIYTKAQASINFIVNIGNKDTGNLPNYGNNDGALFFGLSSADYSDFRPQINALSYALNGTLVYNNPESLEDTLWYNPSLNAADIEYSEVVIKNEFREYGFYILRNKDIKIIIRCGSHKHRPSQADNLHIDVWKGSENVLIDGGTYKYNTTKEELNFFMGTGSHNTVILADENQMQRGGHFIWYHWTQSKSAELIESKEQITFSGEISCFYHLGKAIIHKRTVVLRNIDNAILVRDSIENLPKNTLVSQNWHINTEANQQVEIQTSDCEQTKTTPSHHSRYYGVKKESEIIKLSTSKSIIKTEIHIN
jgi:hypothetical protein